MGALEEEEKKEMAGLMDDDEGDSREERAFRMWMNSLGIPKMYVNNLFKKLSNTNYAVDLGKQMKLSLVGVGGSDITDRNKKLILGFVWQLMRYHLLKFLSSISADGKPITDKDVLAWCNQRI